jgi:hypothetical protein
LDLRHIASTLETVWKVLGGRDGGLRSAPWQSRRYPTDLSDDDEWRCISAHLLPEPAAGWGRPRVHGLRAILDAVFFYVLKRAAALGDDSCPEGLPALEERL